MKSIQLPKISGIGSMNYVEMTAHNGGYAELDIPIEVSITIIEKLKQLRKIYHRTHIRFK